MDANPVLGVHRSAVGQQLRVSYNVFVFIVKSPEETEIPLLLVFFSLGGHLPLYYFPGSSKKNPLTIIYILTLILPHTLPGIFILKLYL